MMLVDHRSTGINPEKSVIFLPRSLVAMGCEFYLPTLTVDGKCCSLVHV